ncbi:Nicotinamidase-like amidase (fragment) [Pseudolactococcus piscium]
MKSLIVIDMQEDYVGSQRNQSKYPYQVDILIDNINQ